MSGMKSKLQNTACASAIEGSRLSIGRNRNNNGLSVT
jgi:hypothetical protein